MLVENDKVVSIEYTLKDKDGEVLDTSEGAGPLDYIHGRQNLIPGLERELLGKEPGASFSVTVEPADAYGEHVDDLVVEISKEQFPPEIEIEVGMQFEADGQGGSRAVSVVEVKDKTVVIDANHPLAGEKLFFDVKVVDVRDATEEELKNGLFGGCNCGGDCSGDCDCENDGGCGDNCNCCN